MQKESLTVLMLDECVPHSPSETDHLFHESTSPRTAPRSHAAFFGPPL